MEIKFLVIKRSDLDRALEIRPELAEAVDTLCHLVRKIRKEDGRNPDPRYIIINLDEPYANEIMEVILKHEQSKTDDKFSQYQKVQEIKQDLEKWVIEKGPSIPILPQNLEDFKKAINDHIQAYLQDKGPVRVFDEVSNEWFELKGFEVQPGKEPETVTVNLIWEPKEVKK